MEDRFRKGLLPERVLRICFNEVQKQLFSRKRLYRFPSTSQVDKPNCISVATTTTKSRRSHRHPSRIVDVVLLVFLVNLQLLWIAKECKLQSKYSLEIRLSQVFVISCLLWGILILLLTILNILFYSMRSQYSQAKRS